MTASENQNNRYYTQEDVQQILQLAIARQVDDKDKEFSYEQIKEIATELEIPLETLKLAETDWQSHHGELQKRRAFDAHRRGKFNKRLGRYIIANGFFLLLNLLTTGGISWSLYILLFWGSGVALDAWNTFQMKGEDYERAFQSWHRTNQLKQSVGNIVNRFLKAASS